jgi:uncharacterized protein YbjT (DUF2867 family)
MARILLTGATGYVGKRLLPLLLDNGHEVFCVVRDRRRFDIIDYGEELIKKAHVVEADFTQEFSLRNLPERVDVAFYLIHSMAAGYSDFDTLEQLASRNFGNFIKHAGASQIVYLGGIANDQELSKHLESRRQVEKNLQASGIPLTVLRAAIIIGSGSASFEIIRDLVEKLPVMITPKWLKSRCQPIAISNVKEYLLGVMLNPDTYGKIYDIGGPDILTYRDMLLQYAEVRKLRRLIITVPVLTPRLSSLWLYFVTSTSYPLARNLVDSIINEAVCKENRIQEIIPLKLFNYKESVERAFSRIRENVIVSSWKDALSNPFLDSRFMNYIDVPLHGCLTNSIEMVIPGDKERVKDRIWSIGGNTGWYYGNLLWKIRGVMDKMVGGVGLRRGRRNPTDLKAGDSLDFWRVILADKKNGRLLLFAEMKLPGEAWLEFRIRKKEGNEILFQKATFRPHGLFGRLYWYLLLPFHLFIFKGMAKNILGYREITGMDLARS